MPASADRMRDVFPISFDFKRGEQPNSEKLTKWVQLTDLALQQVTEAIGDPWSYNAHVNGNSSRYYLSFVPLAQANLARALGPIDMISPGGNSFGEDMSSFTVLLRGGHNQWKLGFPLAQATGDMTIAPDHNDVESIDLANDLSFEYEVGGATNEFVTLVGTRQEVTSQGKYYIDWTTGEIITYTATDIADNVNLTISNLHHFGAGAPWASHNVIPHFYDDVSQGVRVEYQSDAGGTYYYEITLPTMSALPRVGWTAFGFGEAVPVSEYNVDPQARSVTTPAKGSSYRIPQSLVNGARPGDAVPEGFMYLWDDNTTSLIPLTEFTLTGSGSTVDPQTVNLACPQLSGVGTTPGAYNDSRYRIMTVGVSLAEQVSYLMSVVRDNHHVGLTVGAGTTETLAYTPPLSHDRLADRFAVSDANEDPEVALYFRESSHQTNPHPQYMHRYGYMANDVAGNTGNAMRGWLVFAQVDGTTYSVDSWNNNNTVGIAWGGGTVSGNNSNATMAFQGAEDLDDWTTGVADRFGFGIDETGAQPIGINTYGAVTYVPWEGTPLYLRGRASSTSDEVYQGAVLGFDLGRQGEMNYVKVLPGYRTGVYDQPNVPVRYETNYTAATYTTPLLMTPSLSFRLTAKQVREFRFRGVPYIEDPFNADLSLGKTGAASGHTVTNTYTIELANAGLQYFQIDDEVAGDFKDDDQFTVSGGVNDASTFTVNFAASTGGKTYIYVDEAPVADTVGGGTFTNDVSEFNRYFTSPGMVGADFFNVYSNAIFFSDTGDGKMTSFTQRGEDWLENGTDAPTGIFYAPVNGSTEPYYSFTVRDISGDTETPFRLGYGWGANLSVGDNITLSAGADFSATSVTQMELESTTSYIHVDAATEVTVNATSGINLNTDTLAVFVNAPIQDAAVSNSLDLSGTSNRVTLNASASGADLYLDAADQVRVTPTGKFMLLAEGVGFVTDGSGWVYGAQLRADNDIYIGKTGSGGRIRCPNIYENSGSLGGVPVYITSSGELYVN